MKKNLTTQSTDLVLKKSKSTLDITKRILSGSKSLTTKSNKDVIVSPDVMMINGLMWQDEPYTKEEKDAYNYGKVLDWDSAMAYAKELRLGGYDDWRLPRKDELLELFENVNQLKNVVSNRYWSSTTIVGYGSYAW